MKTITTTTKIMLATALIITTHALFAQGDEAKKDEQKYKLHIVRDENGKKEVIDMAFPTRAEMDDYIKQKNIDLSSEMAQPGQEGKNTNPKGDENKREKKIVIIEKDESGLDKDIDLEIGLSAFTEAERMELIQQLLNVKNSKMRIIQITKSAPAGKGESMNQEDRQPGTEVNQPANTNLADVKVFPNPNHSGQFHVSFSVNKPSAIKLRITDLQGKEVYAYALKNYSGTFNKDIIRPGLANGTYVLDIEAGGEKETTKVVMQ